MCTMHPVSPFSSHNPVSVSEPFSNILCMYACRTFEVTPKEEDSEPRSKDSLVHAAPLNPIHQSNIHEVMHTDDHFRKPASCTVSLWLRSATNEGRFTYTPYLTLSRFSFV